MQMDGLQLLGGRGAPGVAPCRGFTAGGGGVAGIRRNDAVELEGEADRGRDVEDEGATGQQHAAQSQGRQDAVHEPARHMLPVLVLQPQILMQVAQGRQVFGLLPSALQWRPLHATTIPQHHFMPTRVMCCRYGAGMCKKRLLKIVESHCAIVGGFLPSSIMASAPINTACHRPWCLATFRGGPCTQQPPDLTSCKPEWYVAYESQ